MNPGLPVPLFGPDMNQKFLRLFGLVGKIRENVGSISSWSLGKFSTHPFIYPFYDEDCPEVEIE